jgi:hypothetical protein
VERHLDWEAQIGILLVVAKNDVEPRPMSLDQSALEDQGLELGSGYDGLKICHVADQQAGLRAMLGAFLEIRPDAVGQHTGLAYVQHFPLGTFQKIDPRLSRAMLELRLQLR